jgi:acyl carrier protein
MQTLRSNQATPSSFHHQLLEVFQRNLARPSLVPTDDFFELGGDSFLAMEVIADVSRNFDYELDLSILIESKSIGAVIEHIELALRARGACS